MDFVEFNEAFAYIAEKASLYYDPEYKLCYTIEERKALPFHIKLEGAIRNLLHLVLPKKLLKWNIPIDTIFDEYHVIKESIFKQYDEILDREAEWCKGTYEVIKEQLLKGSILK
jgi:hypothetical protein